MVLEERGVYTHSKGADEMKEKLKSFSDFKF